MPKVIKKTVKTTITQTDGSFVEETVTKIEVSEEALPKAQPEKNTFFIDDEEHEDWFQKQKEEDEDDSIDIYILDDDKSW